MSSEYMITLEESLHVKGRARRRILAECREHLVDLGAAHGDTEAIARFGSAEQLAAEFDTEVARARGVSATWFVAAALIATAYSTLVLINSADVGANGAIPWAIVFFAAAQVAATACALAMLQAFSSRYEAATPADVALLARRSRIAAIAAAVTLFSAGGAIPGHASPLALLVGPVLLAFALFADWRSSHLVRQVDGGRLNSFRSPFVDLRKLTKVDSLPTVGPLPVALVAAAAMGWREHGELGSTAASTLTVAALEVLLVFVAYYALRRPLGLGSDWHGPSAKSRSGGQFDPSG